MVDLILSERQKMALWFVRLRWAAIALMLFVVLLSIFVGRLNMPLLPNLVVISIGFFYNLSYPYLIKRYPWFSENDIFTLFRSTADMLVITLMVHFTGGVESPLKLLYLLELSVMATVGLRYLANYLALECSLLYFLFCFSESILLIPHYQLTNTPASLYLNVNYAIIKAISLFFSSLVLIYIVSFLVERLQEKQKEIETLSNAKMDFVNIVMHETKSPLTSVMGYADVLINQTVGPLSEAQKEPLAIIKRQSLRILNMVNDLLSIARLESGRAKLEKKPHNIIDIARNSIEDLQPLIAKKNVSLVEGFAPDPPLINVDADKITEVFINLLSNAIKFSNEGGKIFITTALKEKELVISVRDEGLGIDPVDLPHIFDKFYRASKESAERKGTGLGLALSKIIVETHGGKMWASSAGLGRGAELFVTLPL